MSTICSIGIRTACGRRPSESRTRGARRLRVCVNALRQLARCPALSAPPTVRICENPAVLAAATDTYGAASAPLVCLQGQPSVAAVTLLHHLHAHGSHLRYHGDFDWGGLRIASALLRRVHWRYTAADYRASVLTLPAGPPLTGVRADAP
ncbi:DUF2399 domain-containing protein [Streptomyces sp. NPDC048496]|uniref:DUF2399 domain-containing protein n=1 Tax=Streptomyces sp. NPDC048496 TaxID=3365558 RepID=UPI0037141295